MLEVGMIITPNVDRGAEPELDMPWNRAHFGAWCVVSAPLVLGIDPSSPDLAKVTNYFGWTNHFIRTPLQRQCRPTCTRRDPNPNELYVAPCWTPIGACN